MEAGHRVAARVEREIQRETDPGPVGIARERLPRRGLEPRFAYRGVERPAIPHRPDRRRRNPEQGDADVAEGAVVDQREREIEGALAAEDGAERVGALAADHRAEGGGVSGLEVGAVGASGIGGDRRGRGAEPDDLYTVKPEHAERLRRRRVDLGPFVDVGWPWADHEDARLVTHRPVLSGIPSARFKLRRAWVAAPPRRLSMVATTTACLPSFETVSPPIAT